MDRLALIAFAFLHGVFSNLASMASRCFYQATFKEPIRKFEADLGRREKAYCNLEMKMMEAKKGAGDNPRARVQTT